MMRARAGIGALCLALCACGNDELYVAALDDPKLLASPHEGVDHDPAPDRVHVRLRAGRDVFRIGDVEYEGYAYDGRLPGPTLRGKVGDTLVVDLDNALGVPTTLHWHGMHVPHAMDGATWQVAPIGPGEQLRYTFELTQAGLFWYHPHFDSAGQVDLGLYGAIVVEAPDEPQLERELVLVFDRWGEKGGAARPGSSAAGLGPASYPQHTNEHASSERAQLWTVNGRLKPRVELPAGERVRARLLNASTRSYLDLRLPSAVRRIAGDQGLLSAPVTSDAVLLGPGDRAELELVLGEQDIVFSAAPYSEHGGSALGDTEELAAIVTTGAAPAPPTPSWPFSGAPASQDPPWSDVVYVLTGDSVSNDWRINGELFPDVTVQKLALGTDAILEIRNASATEHPFHLHGHAFEVLSIAGVPALTKTVEDTLNVRIGEAVRLKVHADIPGDWMAHCHILEHAEAGMMTVLRIE